MQENPHASLDVLGTYYWVRGLTHPLRRGDVAIASTVFVIRARAVISQVSGSHVLGHSHFTGLAYPYCDLLTVPSLNCPVAGTLTFLHTQNKETICTVLSFDGDSVNARGSQRIFQRVTISILPCLSGLFPLSDLWYSSRSPSHQPSTSLLCVLQLSLSRTTPHRYSVGD